MDSSSKPRHIVRECWDQMQRGSYMMKAVSHTGPLHRSLVKKRVHLDEGLHLIHYRPARKTTGIIELANMTGVVPGEEAKEIFSKFSKKHDLSVCFSILMTNNNSFNLIADSETIANHWIKGLKALISNKDNMREDAQLRERWLKEAFERFDQSGDGMLQHEEITKLLFSLNVSMSPDHVLKKLKEFTRSSQPELDKEQFTSFFKCISSRQEIVQLVRGFSESGSHMTVEDLKEFLENIQNMKDVTDEYCTRVIELYEPTNEGKENGYLGIDGLTRFLLTREGDILESKHDQLYQDMNQPLSHYYIASSHKTYLVLDQQKGAISVQGYIKALDKGCRYVEVECWDGEEDEPVVNHDNSTPSKVLFKDVIKAINDHAFKMSEYPLIVDIKNHCSIGCQIKMAHYLQTVLGDKLFKDSVDIERTILPSPELLKNKVIIKGKKFDSEQEHIGDGEVSEEDESTDITPEKTIPIQPGPSQPSTSAEPSVIGECSKGNLIEARKGSQRISSVRRSFRRIGKKVINVNKAISRMEEVVKSKKKIKLTVELSNIVNYLQSTRFKSLSYAREYGQYYHCSTIDDRKLLKITEKDGTEFINYNKRHLTRVYSRISTGNYNPMIAWTTGSQIVALNYHSNGQMMDLNQGKFRDNGGVGYVLKPSILTDESLSLDPFTTVPVSGIKRKKVKIKVISGQQLPKPRGSEKGEIIDPYVLLEVHGIPVDTTSFQTKTVRDNGFSPMWNETFEFGLLVPELSLIRFSVFDEDIGMDEFVGQFTLPFTSMRTGFRHVFLSDEPGNVLELSSLFIHIIVS